MKNEIVRRKIEFLALGLIAVFACAVPWLSIPFAVLLIMQCQSAYKNKVRISSVVFLFLSIYAIALSFVVIYHWSKDITLVHYIKHGKIFVYSGSSELLLSGNRLGTLNMLVFGVLCLVFRKFFAKEMQYGVHRFIGKTETVAEPQPIFVIYITIFGVISTLFAVWLLFREVLGGF